MRNRKSMGITLIEVLIALAIVAIAMTAVIKATGQNIRSTDYLQNKTCALWVAKLIVNETTLDILRLSPPQNMLEQSTTLLGREWFWRVSKNATPNRHISKITVSIFRSEEDREEDNALLTVESYVYKSLNQVRVITEAAQDESREEDGRGDTSREEDDHGDEGRDDSESKQEETKDEH